MGVPAFFKWLTRRYPRVVSDVIEEECIDSSSPNPNKIEFDNLYLDMNGIIHPCCHPENKDAPPDEASMIREVFKYIDRIFAMVRPRKVLYMAIDGVAPRAKMNQQRSRRFRAALDIKIKEEAEKKLREEFIASGRTPPPVRPRPWDSNVITPGTPFMARLAEALHYYIADRISNDPGWRGVKVIFSDAKMPGEGEHKIMAWIRLQRAAPGYNPNTVHCLYGMDADLIMLGLSSHDPNFHIIREEVLPPAGRRCTICNQEGHVASECKGAAKKQEDEGKGTKELRPFQFVHLNVLREYLANDLYVEGLPFAWDLERVIDDFVFLCFFVGNDFLPHLPSLDIREGALETLMKIYKRLLPATGYLASNGRLDLSRIDVLLSEVGAIEDSVFRNRKRKEEMDARRERERKEANKHRARREREATVAAANDAGFTKLGGSIHSKYLQSATSSPSPPATATGTATTSPVLARSESDSSIGSNDVVATASSTSTTDNNSGATPTPPTSGVMNPARAAYILAGGDASLLPAQPPSPSPSSLPSVAGPWVPGLPGVTGGHSRGSMPPQPPPPSSTAEANRKASQALKARIGKKRPLTTDGTEPPSPSSSAATPATPTTPSHTSSVPPLASPLVASSSTSDVQPMVDESKQSALPPAAAVAFAETPSSSTDDSAKRARVDPEVAVAATSASESATPSSDVPAAVVAAVASAQAAPPPVVSTPVSVPMPASAVVPTPVIPPSPLSSLPPPSAHPSSSPSSSSSSYGTPLSSSPPASSPPPSRSSYRGPPVCRQWIAGSCRYGDRCRFAHSNTPVPVKFEDDTNDDIVDDDDSKEEKKELSFEERMKEDERKRNAPPPEEDKIRLGDAGWNERYYSAKLGLDKNDPEHAAELKKMYKAYAEGLCWVMLYYYHGVQSWEWYYPYHYAPMASDLKNIDQWTISFEMGKPFSPIAQLMGVLPALSSHCMPPACRALMSDPSSPIIDFYPETFKLDMNGKKFAWQAVCLLPWIDEKRLLRELAAYEHTFTDEERYRNAEGMDYLFFLTSHPLANFASYLYLGDTVDVNWSELTDAGETHMMHGFIRGYPSAFVPGDVKPKLIGHKEFHNGALSAEYKNPIDRPHLCQLLPGLAPIPRVLNEHDFQEAQQRDRGQYGGRGGPRFGQAPSFQADRARAGGAYGHGGEGTYGRQDFTSANTSVSSVGHAHYSSPGGNGYGHNHHGGRGGPSNGYSHQHPGGGGGYHHSSGGSRHGHHHHNNNYNNGHSGGGYGGGNAAYSHQSSSSHLPGPYPSPVQGSAMAHAQRYPQQQQSYQHQHYQHGRGGGNDAAHRMLTHSLPPPPPHGGPGAMGMVPSGGPGSLPAGFAPAHQLPPHLRAPSFSHQPPQQGGRGFVHRR